MSVLRSVCTAAVTAATVGALAAPPAAAAPPPPPTASGGESVSATLRNLQSLYRKTEAASEAYNGTAERLTAQRSAVRKANAQLRTARSRLASGRAAAGGLARQQYREETSGLPASVQQLLARDPQSAMAEGRLLERAAQRQAMTVHRLTSGEQQHSRATQRAQRTLAKQQRLAQTKKSQRDTVRSRLKQVEATLASLSGTQLEELRSLESRQTATAQRKLLGTGVLAGARAPSQGGERALRYAAQQVGKPYRWGANGPESFDCSGLTSQAWRRSGGDRAAGAGTVPRTSQEQWRQLDRVRLRELRPGDLVVYFPGATHVALYAGDGKVVQAPRPGESVRVSPMASHPVLGAVRPDPGADPVSDYQPPQLPTGT